MAANFKGCLITGCENLIPGRFFVEHDSMLYCAEHEDELIISCCEIRTIKRQIKRETHFEKDLQKDLSEKMKGLTI